MATQSVRINDALKDAWSMHLDAFRQHLPGAQAGVNGEDLHQLRIALRKTRALLTLFRETLPQANPFKDEFKWLAGATGEVRDLDVLSAQASLRAKEKNALDAAAPVLAQLRDQRATAQKKLSTTLRSKRVHDLIESWQQFLAELPARTDLLPMATVPAWTAIKVIIIKQSRRLLQDGVAVDLASDAHELHELRIRGKRLRYLLESFDALAGEHGLEPLAKKLRKLQTVLGSHQDASVAVERWQGLAVTLEARGNVTPTTIALLEEWQSAAREEQRETRLGLAKALKKFAKACDCL